MGRYRTGAISTKATERIELGFLMKKGFVSKGKFIQGKLSWNNGNSAVFSSEFTSENKYFRLQYNIRDAVTGELIQLDYKIQLVSITSNLGNGMIYYFVCPISGRYCRILYLCYGSQYFKCRKAYMNRIYYPCQIASKNYYNLERLHSLESTLNKLYQEQIRSHYQGKETRKQKRIKLLQAKLEYYDKACFMDFERICRRHS